MDFHDEYEKWYSEARQVIKTLIPDRLADFEAYYKLDKRKDITYATYMISDALIGLVTTLGIQTKCEPKCAIPKMLGQVHILESARKAVDGLLFNLRTILQADLSDGELEEAKVLNRNGYSRAAGVVSGVVLEKHLLEVPRRKNVSIAKKDPSIGDLNDALKNAGAIEVED